MSYESYDAYLLVNGVSNRIKNVTHTKNAMKSTFTSSPSYYPVSINSSTDLKDVWVVDDSETKDHKLITSLDYVLQNGDIIDWQGLKWINVITDYLGDIYTRGKLKRCMSSLKWIDLFGNIHEAYFAYNSDGMSNFGLDEGRIITLDNERRNIIIAKDEHSSLFKKEQRFIFDGRAWKISAIDKLNPQLITLVLEATEIDAAKDNIELRIANYIAPHYEIIVDKTSLSLQVGDSKTFDITVKNNGITIPSPSLSFLSSDESICVVDVDGSIKSVAEGNAVVTVTFKDVSLDIVVNVTSSISHNFTVEIIDSASTNKFAITKSKSKTFTCQFKDNGIDIIDTGTFSVTPISVSTSNIATITSQGNNSCVIRGDNAGTVILTVTNVNGTIVGSQVITIKNVI